MMNAENDWYHATLCEIKEGPADCITVREVTKALEKINKHKAPGLSGVVTDYRDVASYREIGVDWLTELCNEWHCERRKHP